MSTPFKVFLWLVAIVVLVPLSLVLGLVALLAAGDFYYSGSARGDEALERMSYALHNVNGRWREVATDARAKWDAPDMNGDQIENYSFTLPPAEIAPFETALKAKWTLRPAGPLSKPDDPNVNYIFEGASLMLNRVNGRVEIEWANFYNLTPTTKPTTRGSPTTS